MKTRSLPLALCSWLLGVLLALPSAFVARGAEKGTERKIYDESAIADKQVADAIVIAKQEHKRILLQFGANWCGWCLKLHKLFESDRAVHEELSKDYVLVLIDVSRDQNKDFALKHQADNHGIPFLVVLDSDGKVLTTKDTDDLEEGDHHNPEKVLAFLKAWQRGSVTSSQVAFARNPKATLISCEDLGGGLKRANFKADNSGPAEILCKVHVEQRAGSETTSFWIPAGGSSRFSFFVRPGDEPKITAEVLQPGPVTRFVVPLAYGGGATNQNESVSSAR